MQKSRRGKKKKIKQNPEQLMMTIQKAALLLCGLMTLPKLHPSRSHPWERGGLWYLLPCQADAMWSLMREGEGRRAAGMRQRVRA